jgi:hypothetical protein
MASHILTSGNPLLWLGNWNTQSIFLLKSFNLPSAEEQRVGPIIRAVTDIFIRHARELWLQRATDSPRTATRPNKHYQPLRIRPPSSRPVQRITALGVIHRSLRIQSGAHPHLRKIQEIAQTHDSNSSQCHFASLERNDTSCLPKRIVRSLYAPSQFITPCNCITSCSKYPDSLTSPCRNALNNTECTAANCTNRDCTNRLTAIPAYLLPILRVVSSPSGVFGYALYNTTPIAKNTFLGNVYGEILTRTILASRKHNAAGTFVLDYRHNNLCLDLTWSSNQFCHLSHSCNPTARLELWRLNNQPTWKVYTNCDIPSNHHITIDYRLHHLPCTSPCQCSAPTCVSTLPEPSLSICGVVNRTHPKRTQTRLNYLTSNLTSTSMLIRCPSRTA